MNIALLISGGGTTAASIIQACQGGKLLGVYPKCVIASSAEAPGIQRIKNLDFPELDVLVIDPKSFPSSESFGQAIIDACKSRAVDFIGQYGWLCLTPANVIEDFKGRMTNQHPGPLDPGRPDFGGRGMFGRRVIAARLLFAKKTTGNMWTEATAQRVDAEFDRGAVVYKKRLDILSLDSVETLAGRLLPLEHEVQIETLAMFERGKVEEIIRAEPLVKPEEYAILEECKAEAIKLYPKG